MPLAHFDLLLGEKIAHSALTHAGRRAALFEIGLLPLGLTFYGVAVHCLRAGEKFFVIITALRALVFTFSANVLNRFL